MQSNVWFLGFWFFRCVSNHEKNNFLIIIYRYIPTVIIITNPKSSQTTLPIKNPMFFVIFDHHITVNHLPGFLQPAPVPHIRGMLQPKHQATSVQRKDLQFRLQKHRPKMPASIRVDVYSISHLPDTV